MKYTGEFLSINDTLYKVEVEIKGGASGTKDLKFSGAPFTSSTNADDKHIYSPIKCGGATIGVLTDYYIEDFYTGQAKGVKVTLFNESESNKVEWIGYVSPTMFTQGFDQHLEEIQVDCVDGIAVLKNIPYQITGDAINTFANIIFNCLKQSECYKYLYITDNVQFTQAGTESIIEKLKISQSNFFEEKDDVAQKDDDVAWSCYDVLYELLQYLGYTLVIEGDSVFIIDYDAIRRGNNKYFRYSLTGTSLGSSTSTTMAYSKFIEDKSYAKNGTSVSLDDIYNKISVKDEFKTFDSLFPTFGDESTETNITAPQVNLSSSFVSLGSTGLQFGDHIKASPADGIMQNMVVAIDKDWRGKYWLNFYKFYDSPVFNMIKYNRNSSKSQANLGDTIKYSDLLNYNGAFYYKWFKTDFYGSFSDYIRLLSWIGTQKSSYNYNASTGDKIKVWEQVFDKFRDLDKLSLTNVIAFINTGDYRFGPGDESSYNNQTDNDVTKNYPFVTLKSYDSSVFGGANHFLRIKGKFCSHDEARTPHKLNNGEGNGDLKRAGDYKRTSQGYIWAKLKWGNQYWNGSDWTTSNVWFKLWYWTEEDQDNDRGLKVENYFDKDFEFKPKEFIYANIGNDGVIIPCPTSGNLSGQAELSFTTRDMWGDSRRSHWHPKGNKFDNFYCRYLSNCVFISDLEVTAEIYDGLLGDADYDSDTVYTNVIDNGSVEEMEEITFKVCTDDGKKPSYSSVSYNDTSGANQYVKNLYNKALSSKENGTYGCDGENAKLRQEEHYVFKLASQYENPMVKLELNLKNEGHKQYGTFTDKTVSGKTFICQGMEINWKMNCSNLTLVEKA